MRQNFEEEAFVVCFITIDVAVGRHARDEDDDAA